MQAGGTHVDLRLPPDLGTDPASRARCEGFAGRTVVENGPGGPTATWHREINLQGPVAKPDIGILSWDRDDLVEDAPDGSYREVWTREHVGPAHARIERQRNKAGDRMRVLAWVADRFALADARPGDMALPTTLAERVAAGEGIDAAFSLGRIGEGGGTVTHSTDPGLVGRQFAGAPEGWTLAAR